MTDRNHWMRLLRDAPSDLAARPQRIAELCVQTLGVDGAGISLLSDTGRRGVVCATDDVSRRIEELQVTLGEGPCIDTVRTGMPVLVVDLHDRDDIAAWRWPTFMAAVADAGVRAVFAFPLRIGAIGLGALDMYRNRPGALDDDELASALLGAEAAAVALLGLETSQDGALADTADTGLAITPRSIKPLAWSWSSSVCRSTRPSCSSAPAPSRRAARCTTWRSTWSRDAYAFPRRTYE